MSYDSKNQINTPKIIVQNSTKPFKNIMLKYNKTSKVKKINNKQILLKNLLTKIQKLAKEEKEKEYFVKEVHRNIEIKDKIVNSFGLRAVNHYDESKNLDVKAKIDKYKFFNPLKANVSNESKKLNNRSYGNNSHSVKNKSHKYINFPDIINRTNSKNDLKSKDKNILDNSNSIIKINEYSFDNKNGYSEIVHNRSNEIYSSKKIIISPNNYITPNNFSVTSSKDSSLNILPVILNTPLKTERNFSCFKDNKTQNSLKKRNIFINLDYINYINNIKEKSVLEEKKKKRFFENYQYGCDKFKLKYNFLKEKYFV